MVEISDKIWDLILKDLRGELSEDESLDLAEWRASLDLNERLYEMGVNEEKARVLGFSGLSKVKTDGAIIREIVGSDKRWIREPRQRRSFRIVFANLWEIIRR
jgi:hypothetical protein